MVAIALGIPVLLIRVADAVEDLVMIDGHGQTPCISRGTGAYRRGQRTVAPAFQMDEAAALALIAGEEADDTAGPTTAVAGCGRPAYHLDAFQRVGGPGGEI